MPRRKNIILVGTRSATAMAAAVGRELDLPVTEMITRTFADGEIYHAFPCDIAGCDLVIIANTLDDSAHQELIDLVGEYRHILLVGLDARPGETTGRSDTMMVAHIDSQAGFVSILSLPRDLRVRLDGYDFQKLNAAYALGGDALAIRTIRDLTGVKIDHYATGGETVTGFARFHRTAACCQNDALFFREFVDHFFFSVTETFFAFYIENPAHISSGSFLNLLIRIVKFHIELLS